jgi:hypothetical protein
MDRRRPAGALRGIVKTVHDFRSKRMQKFWTSVDHSRSLHYLESQRLCHASDSDCYSNCTTYPGGGRTERRTFADVLTR